jgi:Na+-transporting NADH:ubiquinone oxidoreductase subunit A
MDTNPLAVNPQLVIDEYAADFANGLTVLEKLTDGKVHVCHAPEATIPTPSADRIEKHSFSGPHPAGLAGTHIHFIDPVSVNKTVWTINYQDVIAVGKLFTTGKLWVERIISLAGPLVDKPRLIKTRLGASTEDLVQGEIQNVPSRIVSGSVLNGHSARNWAAFLGRFHTQVSVIAEGDKREVLGWVRPELDNKFSLYNVFFTKIFGKKDLPLSSSQNGSPRAMVPTAGFERVVPMDILPTQLLRALLVKDTDTAQALGCLELDEEDLALCSYVCSGKYEYGPALRTNLTQIEKEG